MAEATRTTDRSLIPALLKDPRSFSFYQAVRLIESAVPGVKVGGLGPARAETIRFTALASLAFPVGDLDEVVEEANPWDLSAKRYRMTQTFFGLYGPASPLPASYTERIIRPTEIDDYEDRERLRAFLDIFNHRLVSLLYRSMSKYRYHLIFEPDGADRFSYFMKCLIGRGTRAMPTDGPVPVMWTVRYAALLTETPKSAESLRGMLADYFRKIQVGISQCIGRWFRVEDRNAIGRNFATLGEDLVLGSRVYDRNGKFRIRLGPLELKDFLRFLPKESAKAELKELVRLYLLDELDFDVEVCLKADDVPPLRLGDEERPGLLGWTTWCGRKPGQDRCVVFSS